MDKSKLAKVNLEDQEQVLKVAHEIIEEMELKGTTIQEAVGLDQDLMEEIYSLAYGFYNQGKNSEALSLFQFLAGVSPHEYRFVLGLAATHHQSGDFANAILGFFVAFTLEPTDPNPLYFLVDALTKEGRNEEAKEFIKIALDVCGDQQEYQALKQRCLLMQRGLS